MTHLVSLHPFQPVLIEDRVVTPDDRYLVMVFEQPGRVLFFADVIVRRCTFLGVTTRGPLLTVQRIAGSLPPSPFALVWEKAKAKARGIRRKLTRVR